MIPLVIRVSMPEELEKGRKPLPEGTLREYGGLKFKKQGGKWVYAGQGEKEQEKPKKKPPVERPPVEDNWNSLTAELQRRYDILKDIDKKEAGKCRNLLYLYEHGDRSETLFEKIKVLAHSPEPETVPKKIPEKTSKKSEPKSELEKTLDKEPKKLPKTEPTKDDKKIAKAIEEATPENRNEKQAEIFGYDPEEKSKLEEIHEAPYTFTPGTTSVMLQTQTLDNVEDYREVVPRNIALVSTKDILEKPRPSWIPELNERDFASVNYRVPAAKIGDNQYLILLQGRLNYKRTTREGVPIPVKCAVVSLDVLLASQDYYMKVAKARYEVRKQEAIEKRLEQNRISLAAYKEQREKGIELSRYNQLHEEAIMEELANPKKLKVSLKAPRMLSEKRMTYAQYDLISAVVGTDRLTVWNHFYELMPDVKQKASDMEFQYEDLLNAHAKGEETSYGDKGTKPALLESHGVLVKRQNGDEITEEQVADVRKAVDGVYSIFGNRSGMARDWNLKISHSGDKAMHARKAAGLFFPHYHAIGVQGGSSTGFILAHEWAHFMDYWMGGKNGWHYHSDNYDGLTGQIARTFRGNMRRRQSSDYMNRTKECFARALEEYYVYKTKGPGKNLAQVADYGAGHYVDQEVFEKELLPKIEQWLAENDAVLKSMNDELTSGLRKSWDADDDDEDEEEKDPGQIQEEAVEKEHQNEVNKDKNKKAKAYKSQTRLVVGLQKGRKGLPIGTKRKYGNTWFVKTAQGWKYAAEGGKEAAPEVTPEVEAVSPSRDKASFEQAVVRMKKKIGSGWVSPKTGHELIHYEWKSVLGEKWSDYEGGFVSGRVSDWESAETSELSGRQIVHAYWIHDKDTGEVKPYGIQSAMKKLGVTQDSLQKRGKTMLGEAQRKAEQSKFRIKELEGRSRDTISEASDRFYATGYKMGVDTILVQKEGKYVRIAAERPDDLDLLEEHGWQEVNRVVYKDRKATVIKKSLEKAKPFPEGTVRTHGGRKMVKRAGGWIPISEGKTQLEQKSKKTKQKKETIEGTSEIHDALKRVASQKGILLDDVKGTQKKVFNTITKLGLVKWTHLGADEYRAELTESGQKALDTATALTAKKARAKNKK